LTSEQIKVMRNKGLFNERDAYFEIASQLARLNERETTEREFWERALLAAVENCAVDNANHAVSFADALTDAWKARRGKRK